MPKFVRRLSRGTLEDYNGYLYVLRYPYGIYTQEEKARYEGLKWIRDSTKTSKLSDLKTFKDDTEALGTLWDDCSYPNHIE